MHVRGAVALLAYLWILGDALESLASLLLSFCSTHVDKSINNYPLMKGLGRRNQAVHVYQDLVSDEQKVTHAKHQPQLSSYLRLAVMQRLDEVPSQARHHTRPMPC